MEEKTIDLGQGFRITWIKGEVTPNFGYDIPHAHEHCEIFFHIAGEIDIFVEQNIYHLSGGEVRLYRTNELHCIKPPRTQHVEWYQISIPHSFFTIKENRILGSVLFDREAGIENVFITKKQNEAVALLHEAVNSDERFMSHYCYSAILRILCIINEEDNKIVCVNKNNALQKLIHTVNDNFKELNTVAELSEITHYSTSYINKVFKNELSITPYQFIIGKKLNEAKNALRTGMTVTEVCDYAGFNDYSNFITLFKKHFNTTPKQWVKKINSVLL